MLSHAQFANPGWFHGNPGGPPLPLPTPEASQSQFQADEGVYTPQTQGVPATPVAEIITPQIQALADSLQDNLTNIFDYVHDQIRFVLYFGSKKGAELTLLEKSGNDFDQCALLVALLRAAGYSNVQYQFGWMELPYDDPNGYDYDVHHWWQLTLDNTDWTTTATYLNNLVYFRGYPDFQYYDDGNTFLLQRTWVQLTIGSYIYQLDPAFKISEQVSGISLVNAMSGYEMCDVAGFLSYGASGVDTSNDSPEGYYTQNVDEGELDHMLNDYTAELLNYMRTNSPNTNVQQILGGWQIIPETQNDWMNAQFTTFDTDTFHETMPILTWTNEPTNIMSTLEITFADTTYQWFMPQLQGQRLALTFDDSGLAQLWQDDALLAQQPTSGSGSTVNVTLYAHHPVGTWNTNNNTFIDGFSQDQATTNTYQRFNSTYAMLYAFEPDWGWLQQRENKLDAYLQQGLTPDSVQVQSETLNVMGLSWMLQTAQIEQIMASQLEMLPQYYHRLGRMAQEGGNGYYVDVYMQNNGSYPSDGDDYFNFNAQFSLGTFFGSALESGIIEEFGSGGLEAASTVNLLATANAEGQRIYMLNNASPNWEEVFETQLYNYSDTAVSNLLNLIRNGDTLLVPEEGSIFIAGPDNWSGDAYVDVAWANNGNTIQMVVGGGYNGGYSPTTEPVDPINVNVVSDSLPTYFDPQPATLASSHQTLNDPVNVADGSFEITSTDLSLGGQEPRGLNLTRYYSSNRRNSNPAGLGPGWLHNYYCNVVTGSAPQAGLGGTTPQQMAPILVATCAAISFYNYYNQPDPESWVVTALIAKWAADQLTNNGVTVNLGKDTIQFIQQPYSIYTPPANCTMTLENTGSGYALQEQHGRTFQFGANNLLNYIVDQYGQLMSFNYNADNQVSAVIDCNLLRALMFTYSGSQLTSVSDNTGRSVSYEYTGADLTSYTDPEQKTSSYVYDTNHQVVATFDALNRLVVTNTYDGFGHITTQLNQGDPGKTWQVYASGYHTMEVDPAGDQRIFTYDNQSRLVAYQDGAGDVTQTFYDGQDHVVQTISALNRTNQFIYDGNNNLIESIDPLGFSNTYAFDSQNNLITSTDARGNSSHFGYNAQFSLTRFTNGNGDWVAFSYNSDGTLASRQDSGGTTSYTYDGYGTLASITYPSSLGSESFVNDPLGDPLSHTDARGFSTSFAYNNRRQLTSAVAPTNLTTQMSYDSVGNISTTTDARNFTTSNTWSVTRHLLATAYPATPQGTPIITNTYDSRDWLAETQNPLSKATYYTNDAAHRLIAVTDPLQRPIQFTYDEDSHQTSVTDAASDLTTQSWDKRGNLRKVIDAATNIIGRGYDPANNVIFLTNRNTNVWQFQYDGANRITNTISPLGHSSSQVYNNRGLLQSTTDPLSQTTSFGYDARTRMTSKADGTGTTTYQYDQDSDLTSVTENGQSLQQNFEAYDRLINYTDVNGYTIQYRRDANGNVTNIVYPGGLTVKYYYDSLNRLTNVTDWSSRQTFYNYDLAGHLTSVARPNNTVRLMSYDNDGELTNIVERTTTQFPIAFYTLNWNNAGRVQWEFKGPLPHPYTPPGRTNTFDVDNRLATFNGAAVTVDANGNLTYGPLTNNTLGAYNYDSRNRLTNAGGIAYGYDPANNRTLLSNGGGVSVYVIDPQTSQVLMRITGGLTNYYIYGVGLLYEVDETATTTTALYYHSNVRGSTIALTDVNGNLTDQFEYSFYGSRTYHTGTNTTPFLYNGQFGVQTDPNGLLYMRARYYNPYISRFINADPSGFGGGLNFYLFCNGNPISETDPFGISPNWGQIGGGAAQVVGGVVVAIGLGLAEAPSGLNSA